MTPKLPIPDGSGGPGGSGGFGVPPVDGELERALSLVARPAADPEFRARLRTRFLDVDQDVDAEARDDASPAPRSPGSRERGPLLPTDDLWRRRLLSLSAIAAAAAVLIAIFVLRPRGPRWQVLDTTRAGIVKIDGSPIRSEERDALAGALPGATIIESGDGRLSLRRGNLYLLDLDPHSRITLSNPDGSRSEPLTVHAERGALRVLTGPDFAGSLMRVSTSDLEVLVSGTAFAVDLLEAVGEQGTCVCCLHGKVEVRSQTDVLAPKPIAPGRMCIVYRDEQAAPTWGDVFEPHALPLREIDALGRTFWPGK